MSIIGEHTLQNGRKYRLRQGGEYRGGDYATGGIHISAWEPSYNNGQGQWVYIDNAPDEQAASEFLRIAARLAPIER